MMEYKLLDILLIIFSTQIIRTYLSVFGNPSKKRGFLLWLLWGVYFIFQIWVNESDSSIPIVTILLNIILVFFIYKISYQVNYKPAIFHVCIFYAFGMIIEIITYLVLEKTGISVMPYGYQVGNVISNITLYLLVHVIKRRKKYNPLANVSVKYWFLLFLIPLASIYIIHNSFYIASENQRNIFFLITTILMILINYITFDVYDKLGVQQEVEKKNLMYEQQIALCTKQSLERETAYQETRRIRHDLNEYLIDLKATVQAGEIDKIETKIDNLLANNQIYKNEISRSGNIVIDSLINYKYSIAQKDGIHMNCHIMVSSQTPFDGTDLCIILGNLIDNALDAMQELPDVNQRQISISISESKEILCISIQNPYNGKIHQAKSGQLQTQKHDKENHGIGLSSVKQSVDKYNGELITEFENGIFIATVLLYPQE